MTVNIEKIYRVVCDDNYQRTTPETYWTKDKQECESYIQSKYYKNLDHIKSIHHCQKLFEPMMSEEDREKFYSGWKKAVEVTRMFK